MLRKSIAAREGRLAERSVVQEPQAQLYGGIPNALVGAVFYVGVALVVLMVRARIGLFVEIPVVFAAGTSVYLARSLTRKHLSCRYCWAAHAVNWLLALLIPMLYVAQ